MLAQQDYFCASCATVMAQQAYVAWAPAFLLCRGFPEPEINIISIYHSDQSFSYVTVI